MRRLKVISKIKLSFIFIIGFLSSTYAQDTQFEWATTCGGIGYDIAECVTLDNNGNVYITGKFKDTFNYNIGNSVFTLTSNGGYDIVICKLDNDGNFIWAKNIGGSDDDHGRSVAIDSLGNVYTVGEFMGIADFDPDYSTTYLTSNGGSDIFICKLDNNGDFIWAKNIGGSYDDRSQSIKLDNYGNSYSTGSFSGPADFDPNNGIFNLNSGGTDVFILKLNDSGDFIWAKNFGDINWSGDYGYSLAIDDVGNVYTTGNFRYIADFDPGIGVYNLTSNGNDDIFICKLDNNGNFIWAKNLGGDDYDSSQSIDIDSSGNVFTTGSFKDTADFDPGTSVYNLTAGGWGSDIFICKLDNDGNFIWAKKFGGTVNDYGYSLSLDAAGNVYTTGECRDSVDYDPGFGVFNSINEGSSFISKLDNDGNFVWAKVMEGFNSYGNSIVLDEFENIYTTGYYSGTIDFDPSNVIYNLDQSTYNYSSWQIYICKYSQTDSIVANFISDKEQVYTGNPVQFTDASLNNPTSWNWDFGDGETSTVQHPTHTYLSSGEFNITLIVSNQTGVDSIIKVNYIEVIYKTPSKVFIFSIS